LAIQRPVAEGRYILEIDGVQVFAAMEATPPGKKHTPVNYQPGNQRNPQPLPGNFVIEECTFKHAMVINEVGLVLVDWLNGVASGDFVEYKNARFLTLDESGRTPIQTWEMLECLPTMFKPDNVSGTGTNVASFSFSLQPTDAFLV
jgi:phage tail-like protein